MTTERPSFTPVFEEDETTIRERLLGRVSDEWRKDPGDFIHDAVVPDVLEVKQLQANQDFILQNAFPQYAEGEYLDDLLLDVGLTREAATPNKRSLTIEGDAGVRIPIGSVLTTLVLDADDNPLEFTTDSDVNFSVDQLTATVNITCSTAGTIGNIATGSQFILQPAIPGVKTITDNGTTVLAEDEETDAEAWERYKLGAQNPDTGGNKFDYVRWVQDNKDLPGIGKATCISRWNGPGTVKVVIVNSDFGPASGTLVNQTQEFLDPVAYTGLGYGKAPAGAAVTVVSATNKAINITATVTYSGDPATAKEAFKTAVKEYLKGIVFEKIPNTETLYPVAYNKIGALLITTKGVENYSGLQINGGTSDVALVQWEVATLGTVTI